jgi:antitoxin component of MazEF toxin-antitoxin module
MTVAIKNNQPIAVPPSVLRRAGFKSGQEIEIKVSGGAITIVPKLSPDERQDERETRDPKVRAAIRKSHEEFVAGKTRSVEQLLAELKLMKPKTASRK